MNATYTINCDLGEGIPHEDKIIPWIDLASIACGGHIGDRNSIAASLDLVRKFEKKAGAHPSYPDRINFGRKTLIIARNDLINSVKKQIQLYLEIASFKGIPADHIKFHGALYNDAAEDQALAELLATFLKNEFPGIPLFVPPQSELEKAALANQLPIRLEIFGDRAYQDDLKLAPRKTQNSLLIQTNQVISHLETILLSGQLTTWSGTLVPIQADTLCFHGDNPGILEFLPQVRKRFWQ
ncbi:5-oxoprolinase subunit PxpA [Algoriphagus jejuensis]|uniref:5-oxoprolinase subunit PxpA n=1 Tax=Algoriphagus jejuensis TaxID=419934 RepID=A0ABP3YLP7_9BACT